MDSEVAELIAKLTELSTFQSALCRDTDAAWNDLEGDGDRQYKRRTFVRTLFGEVEGVIYAIKQTCLHSPVARYSNAELAMLKEESYKVNDNGQAAVNKAKIRLAANLHFALEMLVRGTSLPAHIEKQGEGWQAFREALRVRDRLMHPKTITDLEVSDQELLQAERGRVWFLETLAENMKRAHEYYLEVKDCLENLPQVGEGGAWVDFYAWLRSRGLTKGSVTPEVLREYFRASGLEVTDEGIPLLPGQVGPPGNCSRCGALTEAGVIGTSNCQPILLCAECYRLMFMDTDRFHAEGWGRVGRAEPGAAADGGGM